MALLTIEIRDDPQTKSCDWIWLNYLLPIKEFIVVSIKVEFILRFLIATKEITAPVIPAQKILPFIFTLIILFLPMILGVFDWSLERINFWLWPIAKFERVTRVQRNWIENANNVRVIECFGNVMCRFSLAKCTRFYTKVSFWKILCYNLRFQLNNRNLKQSHVHPS